MDDDYELIEDNELIEADDDDGKSKDDDDYDDW